MVVYILIGLAVLLVAIKIYERGKKSDIAEPLFYGGTIQVFGESYTSNKAFMLSNAKKIKDDFGNVWLVNKELYDKINEI